MFVFTGHPSQCSLLQSFRSKVLPGSGSEAVRWTADSDKGTASSCSKIMHEPSVLNSSSVPFNSHSLFPVCCHRANYTRRHDSRGSVRQLCCTKANSWTPGSSDSQSTTVTTHRLRNPSTLSSLFVYSTLFICIVTLSLLLYCSRYLFCM